MTFDDKRCESRIRSRGKVTLLAEGFDRLTGTIYDISVSGLGVDVETPSDLCPGTPVVIDGQGFAAEGVVRFCGRRGAICRIGVQLTPAESA